MPLTAIDHFALAETLAERGDGDGALAAYRAAATSGDPDVAPIASFNLGVMLQELGDLTGAQGAYAAALEWPGPTATSAALNRGLVLQALSREDEAAEMFQRVLDEGLPHQVATAGLALGIIRAGQDRAREALRAWETVMEHDEGAAAAMAEQNAGQLLADLGLTEEAEVMFRAVIARRDLDQTPHGMLNLGVLYARTGRRAEAAAVWTALVDVGHPELSPVAFDYVQELAALSE